MSLRKTLITTAFAAAVATASGASAQDTMTDPAMTAPAPVEEDDDGGRWGLLGLLGLAGLLGLKRRDRDDVDRRNTTGTGTGTTR